MQETMTQPATRFAVVPFLLEDEHPSQTMRAIRTILGSCDKAIAQAAPKSQSAELQKAILEEFKAANQIASLSWHDLTVIYRPDTDRDGNNICAEILCLETNDAVQHFPPFKDLEAGFVIPTERDVSAEIEELDDRVDVGGYQ